MAEKTVKLKLEALVNLKADILTKDKCTQMNIRLEFLDLENPESTESKSTPLFFKPLSTKFLAQYPVDMVMTARSMKELPDGWLSILDYEDAYGEQAAPETCVAQIYQVLLRRINNIFRENVPDGFSLADAAAEWEPVDFKHPLSSACNLRTIGFHSQVHEPHDIFHFSDNRFPHLIMCMDHYSKQPLPEGCPMTSELIFILRAMQLRYNKTSRAANQQQPVLLLSFMHPQHGRVIQAHIADGKRLVVASSKLYSFKMNQDAPFDLFSRWLLADPIGMDPVMAGTFPE